ncbi:N-acylneuraminate-9-phosphatase isoform X2 [Dendroctonus ponderosae]|uniref:N-acylneuraminate-9-phosphatase isoform X2 n=1 Tax=Dendroctonus ponderosae TaxID=77166 RepID=UPI0020363392|nr:N-acylneuraminate-9-phosphatase isoform X2 [Dendroctonus ponderosae]
MNQNQAEIKCILFDLDNTLIETRKADTRVCEKIANELRVKFNVTHDEANSISSSFLSNFRKCPENTLMSLDKWRTYLWSQALGDKYQQYAKSLYQNWLYQRYQNLAMPDELKSLLETLRMKFRIALITNGTSACQWEKIEKLHLKDCFDLILVSGDLSYEKPDKHIFFQACELLNVKPKNCLMVGDKLETDIQGGFDAGLSATVWISRNTHYYLTETDPKPDYILSNIMEFKYLIANLLDMENMRDAAKKLQDCSLYCDDDSACAGPSFSDHHKRMFSNVFTLDEDSNSNASDGS